MFDFARPDLKVYALPLLALLVLAMAWSRALPGWGRRAVSWVLRSAVLILCLLALALPEVRRDIQEEKALILLVDVSASLPRAERERALAEVREVLDALRAQPPAPEPPQPPIQRLLGDGDRPRDIDLELLTHGGRVSTALVAFAGDAALVAQKRGGVLAWTEDVDRALADAEALDPLHSRVAPALTLAASLFPGVSERRVLVWTDGRLEEPISSAAEWRAASGARSLVLYPLGIEAPRDVRVVDLQVPSDASVGELWNAVLSVEATAPGPAKVTLSASAKVISASDVKLQAGRQEVTFPNLQLPEGLHKITATIEAPGDVERNNDVGLAAIRVRGKYRILLVEGVSEAGEAFSRALAAQEVPVDRIVARDLPRAKLSEYGALVLAEVAPRDLPRPQQLAVKQFVEEQGGGLFVVTGPKQEVAAGYRKSALESLLPVAFREADPPAPEPPRPEPPRPEPPKNPQKAKVEVPGVALLLLIDRSGSMVGDKIKLASEAAIAACEALHDDDLVCVIAFDEEPHWVFQERVLKAGKREYIADLISRIRVGGGTDIFPALRPAHKVLRAIDAQVKHVVLLSDGFTPINNFQGLVSSMAADKITVTAVAVGRSSTAGSCRTSPRGGRGASTSRTTSRRSRRSSWTRRSASWASSIGSRRTPRRPRTLRRTPRRLRRSPPMGQPKPPDTPPTKPPDSGPTRLKLKDEVTFLAGVDLRTLPIVEKRVKLDARIGFYPVITKKEGEPFLATGRAGLGRTAVLATDLRGDGAPEWVRWKELPRVLAQLAKSLSSQPQERRLSTRIAYRLEDRSAVLSIDVPEERIGGIQELTQRLLWRMPKANPLEVPLERLAPGRYEARVPLDRAGLFYVAELEQRAANGIHETTEAGIARAYDLEFARPGRDAVRFRRLTAGEGAMERPDAATACRLEAPVRTTRWGYGAWFLLAAVALLPIDLAVRRWRR